MKTVVFGGGGMLGTDLVPVWQDSNVVSVYTHKSCDVSDISAVRRVLSDEKPDLVLLLAAATDVDRCQTDDAYAFRTNSIAPEIVAQQCSSLGISLVYVSTIAVFNGEKDSPYTEYDLPCPLNRYGISKYHGEQAVRTFCPNHWIVRTSWLFGGGMKDMKFVAKILRKAATDDRIFAVRDCVGSPTYTVDLACGILKLVKDFQFGTYHLVNGGIPASRYELARETLRTSGYSSERISPCFSSDFDLPAPRPRMEAAQSIKLTVSGNRLVLPDWQKSLSSYVEKLKAESVF